MKIGVFLHHHWREVEVALDGILKSRHVLAGFIELDLARGSDALDQSLWRTRKIKHQIGLSDGRIHIHSYLPVHATSRVAGKTGENIPISKDDFPLCQRRPDHCFKTMPE